MMYSETVFIRILLNCTVFASFRGLGCSALISALFRAICFALFACHRIIPQQCLLLTLRYCKFRRLELTSFALRLLLEKA